MRAQSSHAFYPHSGQAEHMQLFAWDVAGHYHHLMKNTCSCKAEERARWGEEGVKLLKWSCFGADGCRHRGRSGCQAEAAASWLGRMGAGELQQYCVGDGGWVWGREEDRGKKQAALELLREDTPSFLPHQPSFQDTPCKAPTMATRHVVTIQPGFSAPPQPSKWHTGKLDCMSDCGVCE